MLLLQQRFYSVLRYVIIGVTHIAQIPQCRILLFIGIPENVVFCCSVSRARSNIFYVSRIDWRKKLVIAPNLLGFGRSPRPDVAYTADDDLAALKKVLPNEPFLLVGHSMSNLLGLEPHTTKI